MNTTHINQPNKVIRIMKRAQNDLDTQQVLSVIKRYNRHWICWMALSPFDTPTRNGDTLPLYGARTAISCYQPSGLYCHRQGKRELWFHILNYRKLRTPIWKDMPYRTSIIFVNKASIFL